jgi:hypothetical protein
MRAAWATAPDGASTYAIGDYVEGAAPTTSETWAAAPGAVIAGTVEASPAPTTTTLTATVDVVPTAANQFLGRIVVFDATTATAALRGQATDVTASTAPGSGKAGLTFTALTTAPAAADTFSIL